MRSATSTTTSGKHRQALRIGPHDLTADESASNGGDDAGPEPHEFLLAGLAACTSITLKMYADRKEWPLDRVHVTVAGERREGAFVFVRNVELFGTLSDEQRARLREVADKCPVHKTLTGTIRIETTIGAPPPTA